MTAAEIAGLYLFSYLLGSIPTTYLAARLVRGIDIREYGSGNVGASNAYRHMGKVWSVSLGLFDLLVKGTLPVAAGWRLMGWGEPSLLLVGAPLLALAGHNWSAFIKFQGGRGISVAMGSLLLLSPLLLAASLLVVGGGWFLTRSSGVWVMVGVALLPAWALIAREPAAITLFCVSLLVLVALKRLLSNWTPLYDGLPRKKVLLNRLLLDRDVDDRAEWVHRTPRPSD